MWLDWISRQTDRTRSPLHWFFYWQLYNDKAKFQWSSLRHRTHLLAFYEFELYCIVKNHTDRCPQNHARIVHDDVIKRKHFPRYWPRVRGIHRSPVHSPHTGQWRGTLMFSLFSGWINGSVDNREAGDLRRHRGHCDVIVMSKCNYSHGISHDNVLSWKPTGLKSCNILSRLTWEFILVSFYYYLDLFAYSCASLSFHSPWLRFTSGFDTNKESFHISWSHDRVVTDIAGVGLLDQLFVPSFSQSVRIIEVLINHWIWRSYYDRGRRSWDVKYECDLNDLIYTFTKAEMSPKDLR